MTTFEIFMIGRETIAPNQESYDRVKKTIVKELTPRTPLWPMKSIINKDNEIIFFWDIKNLTRKELEWLYEQGFILDKN